MLFKLMMSNAIRNVPSIIGCVKNSVRFCINSFIFLSPIWAMPFLLGGLIYNLMRLGGINRFVVLGLLGTSFFLFRISCIVAELFLGILRSAFDLCLCLSWSLVFSVGRFLVYSSFFSRPT